MGYTRFMDSAEVAQALASSLRHDATLAAVWLFGSVARGTATPRSDIDVAILKASCGGPSTRDDITFDLADRLSRELENDVQVIDVERVPDDLVHRLLRDGLLVVDRDRSRRIAFEVRSRNRYFDMRPIWQRYRQPLRPP
jgi:uncharacterized protein